MNTLLKLLVALGLDAKNYDEGMDKAKGKAQGTSKSIVSSFESIGKKMTSVGTKMTTMVTLPILGAGIAATAMASDLNETISKTNVVFEEQANRILEFGNSAATSLGMSKNEALSATGTFGNLFRSMEIGTSTSADMSLGLVNLGSDLASFNNMNPTEVLDKLRAGISGETEPLKTLGININAATVEAKAMEMGLKGADEELSAAAKAQATYALIMEQTTLAQGDFARTSDGLANSTRIAKAQLADAAATLGQNLIPIALQLVGVLNKVLAVINSLPPGAQQTILVVAAIAAVIGPLLTVLGSLFTSISAIATFMSGPLVAGFGAAIAAAAPVIAIVAALIAIVVVMGITWKNNLETIKKVWAWVQGTFGPAWRALGNLLDSVLGLAIRAMSALWEKNLATLRSVGTFLSSTFGPILERVGKFLSDTFGPAIEKVNGWLDGMRGAFDGVANAVGSVIQWINTLAENIDNLELPDWLTPGSPTPLELGLIGIGRAMRDLNTMELPEFSAKLKLEEPSGVSELGQGSRKEPKIEKNNTYYIYSRENPGQIGSALTVAEFLGGPA